MAECNKILPNINIIDDEYESSNTADRQEVVRISVNTNLNHTGYTHLISY